jgi:hypothetical protein
MIVTSNEGNLSVPLSPWIVAHRISHALANLYNASYEHDYGNTFIPLMKKAFKTIYEQQVDFDIDDYNPMIWLDRLANQIGTMHSTNTKKIVYYRGGEFYHELFAQYICSGKVTLKRKGFETFDFITGDKFVNPNLDYAAVDKAMSSIERVLNEIFEAALKEAKGKYYVL